MPSLFTENNKRLKMRLIRRTDEGLTITDSLCYFSFETFCHVGYGATKKEKSKPLSQKKHFKHYPGGLFKIILKVYRSSVKKPQLAFLPLLLLLLESETEKKVPSTV